jgi:hypothetical protein
MDPPDVRAIVVLRLRSSGLAVALDALLAQAASAGERRTERWSR